MIMVVTIFVLDEVQLSNSGPAIAGSEILFKAVVLDGASHPVYDTTHFEYNWFNTVDGYKVCNIDVMMIYVMQAQSAIGSKVRKKAKIRNQVRFEIRIKPLK